MLFFFAFAIQILVLHTWAMFGKTNGHMTFSDWCIMLTVVAIFCYRRADRLEVAYVNVDHRDISADQTIQPSLA